MERDGNEENKEDYNSKYTEDDLALLDTEAIQRTEELEKLRRLQDMQEKLRLSAEKGKEILADSSNIQPLNDADRLARSRQREQEALVELNKALAEARLKGRENPDTPKKDTDTAPSIDEDTGSNAVVKAIKKPSDYFNTLAENEPEPRLIKAIIDEEVKAVDGSRVRLRLLDDVEINELVVPKGSYLYAIMSGFGSQRVKGNVKSLMVADELVTVSLTLYDTDGMEGLYVPSSSFRETSKEVGASALNGNISMNNGSAGNSFTQWGMQAVQNAYQRTSNALSKAVKQNKVKLKYGTFVYLVNGKDKKMTDR